MAIRACKVLCKVKSATIEHEDEIVKEYESGQLEEKLREAQEAHRKIMRSQVDLFREAPRALAGMPAS